MTDKEIQNTFTYHTPNEEQIKKMADLRFDAKCVAAKIQTYCPECREKSIALTRLQECIMMANAAIIIPKDK